MPDVLEAFERLPAEGEARSFSPGATFDNDPWAYTFSAENDFGLHNHFQGIARVGDRWFVSGGDLEQSRADVFVASADTFVSRLDLDAGLEWHAGGLASLDEVLVVPTEKLQDDQGSSTIHVLDVSDPTAPVVLDTIERGAATRSHAVGIARTSDGMVLASWDDRQIDLYVGADFVFGELPSVTLDASAVVVGVPEVGTPGVNGQSFTLVEGCDGELYALLADNTSDLPVDGGTDFLDLYRITVDPPRLEKIGSRTVACPPEQGCNLRAAGGGWVDADGGLQLYGAAFYRAADGSVPWASFSP